MAEGLLFLKKKKQKDFFNPGHGRWRRPWPCTESLMKSLLATVLLFLSAALAFAASASGYSALAFGALLGSYAPILDGADKTMLGRLFQNQPVPAMRPIIVTADSVTCRAGDVDIAGFACSIDFGRETISLTGRRANELFATAAETGIPSDGAAGTIYESAKNIRCVIDPNKIAQHDGSGADCSFEP